METELPRIVAPRQNWRVVATAAIAILVMLIFAIYALWECVYFKISVTDLTTLLAPVAFAAAVIERAVEILISPWRDTGANKLQSALAAIRASSSNSVSNDNHAAEKAASDALDEYRGVTQRYAFAISIFLSLCVSIAGVRAFQPFLDSTKFAELTNTHPHQHEFFIVIDIVLSAAVLAGGADGVHSIANAITTFFDHTADRTGS